MRSTVKSSVFAHQVVVEANIYHLFIRAVIQFVAPIDSILLIKFRESFSIEKKKIDNTKWKGRRVLIFDNFEVFRNCRALDRDD